ncbi:SufBD protein [Tepidanaerobacter acetatoxydans Re1]|uniref:SufBD protein n=1 Tax=Tepidanaerobacter acetatoxydans (strain DSM 21804 / JCM 16047 / Re1) TaxID=1209989 RepID=F4LVY3_TEPAE|nr:SufD family Fe-S cluster assembly protein [Tepidanaerobacter acetatoxydans]AEE91651.1 SufBD protein [Tepidanaerobacter acetatoxydans Re1]CCP26393.1 SufBD protein [Tepidanaerobacter acetatoxydans Re1]
MKLNAIENELLKNIADLHKIPSGAVNIRKNGEGIIRHSSANIEVRPKTDKPGIDVIIAPGTKNEAVHIPVLITMSGVVDVVYNTIIIGEGADVTVVAGCGIHNPGSKKSQHDGIHEIIVKKGAKMRYLEKHYGEGEGSGERVLNPQTLVMMEQDSMAEMELVQIKGVDSTVRDTKAKLAEGASLIITERLLTHQNQEAVSDMTIELNGRGSNAKVVSRSVAKDNSKQVFRPIVIARASSKGHVECDSIIMDQGKISSTPAITAEHPDAQLTHEAAIGRIAEEQLLKLMTLGLSEEEAEDVILRGFLQ